jgi:hypothetical protein
VHIARADVDMQVPLVGPVVQLGHRHSLLKTFV